MNLISASICSISSTEIKDDTLAVKEEQEMGRDEGSETLESIKGCSVTNFKDGKTLNVLKLHSAAMHRTVYSMKRSKAFNVVFISLK